MTKQLKDLNLLDRFLFAEAMEDTVYDTEVQKENTHNLPHRSRLYQGVLDSKLLPPGTVDFNNLNDVFIILIMPFDLFGYGLYRYTFRMECEEVPGLKLSDGATRIFLNTRGKNPEDVSPELIELLHYMEHSTDEISQSCKSDRIHQMHQRVSRIKSSEEIGVKFMQAWEEKILDKQNAREEGIATGRAEILAQVHSQLLEKIRKKLEKGYSPEEIADFLEEDVEVIQNLIEEIRSI